MSVALCYKPAMTPTACASCKGTKGLVPCGGCESPVCKRCAQSVEKDRFAFLDAIPPELSHRTYCGPCFTRTVAPAMADYDRTMARARNVFVFDKGQGELTRLLKRAEKPVRVVDCADREETLLRLAFAAVRRGCNTLIDVDVSSRKVRHHGYQTSAWQGTGVPIALDAAALARLGVDEKVR